MKARPTSYKGIEMRSRTEAGFAMWLDRHGVTWEYEPQCFADDTGQYLPDFKVVGLVDASCCGSDGETPVFVEVKHSVSAWTDGEIEHHARILANALPLSMDGANRFLLLAAPDGLTIIDMSRVSWQLDPFVYWYPGLWTPTCSNGVGFQAVPTVAPGPWAGQWWKGTRREDAPCG